MFTLQDVRFNLVPHGAVYRRRTLNSRADHPPTADSSVRDLLSTNYSLNISLLACPMMPHFPSLQKEKCSQLSTLCMNAAVVAMVTECATVTEIVYVRQDTAEWIVAQLYARITVPVLMECVTW